MVKYIYCLTSGVALREALPAGLGDVKVQRIESGKINVLVSEIGSERLVGTVRNILDHQKVVQAAMESFHAVIPCRFGTRFHDVGELLTLLEHHAALVEAKLAMLAEKVEVGVHVLVSAISLQTGHTPEEEDRTRGIQYLIEKRQRFETSRALSAQVEHMVHTVNKGMTPWWTAVHAHQRPADQGVLLKLCYLVEQKHLAAFKRAYDQFRQDVSPLKLLYTGPWPPYSFATINFNTGEEEPAAPRCVS